MSYDMTEKGDNKKEYNELLIHSKEIATTTLEYQSVVNGYIGQKYNLNNFKGTVYHYTDISGFLGMFESKSLWLSNIRFMNDREEFYNGKKLCEQIINEELKNSKGDMKIFLDELNKRLNEGYFLNNISNHNIFSASFCENGDLLSLWRGYGRNGGISFGIDISKMLFLIHEEEFNYDLEQIKSNKEKQFYNFEYISYEPVIYLNEVKQKIISDILNLGIDYIKLNKSNINAISNAVDGISNSLFYLFPRLKNESFMDEKECRIIYYCSVSKHNKNKIYYREKNNLILPYVKCKIIDSTYTKEEFFPITDIVVGPNYKQEDMADSIKYFLQHNGYEYLVDKVRLSKVPYRDF